MVRILSLFQELFDAAEKDEEGLVISSAPIPVTLLGVDRRCKLTLRDLHRTSPGMWLNDEIVNAYIETLNDYLRFKAASKNISGPRIRILK
jgi:Ulp1 family protease